MEAKELRLGNYVLFNDKVVQVVWNDFEDNASGLEPIPLTEEWILKFGFNKYGEWFIINNMFAPYINISIKHNKTTIGDNEEYDIEMIKYVHHLQNLYFALTRKELCTHDQ